MSARADRAHYGDGDEDLPLRVMQRLNRLFETLIHPVHHRPWRNGEVAAATGVSAAKIAAFRRGRPLEPIHRDLPTDSLVARFTERLGHYVQQDGRSNLAIATEAHMASEYLARLLQGRSVPTIGKLEPLAKALGVDVVDLTTDSLGALARHFEKHTTCAVSRKYLTHERGPEVDVVKRHLDDVAALRRLEENPNLRLAFRRGDVQPGSFAAMAAIVERRLGELTKETRNEPPCGSPPPPA